MKGPDPRQISCHHDRYGKYVGQCSNIVTEVAIQKEKHNLDSIEFQWIFEESYVFGNLIAKPLGYVITAKRGGKTGKALDWYLEDATAAAVANMENGNGEAGERIPLPKPETSLPKPHHQLKVIEEEEVPGRSPIVAGIAGFLLGIIVGALAFWLLRQ